MLNLTTPKSAAKIGTDSHQATQPTNPALTDSVWKTLGVYLVALVLTMVVTVLVFRLWEVDLGVLFIYGGDMMQYTLWVQGVIENGWYVSNTRIGAPGGHHLHEFLQPDAIHFLLIKAMTCFTQDASRIVNWYVLVSFPLTTLIALFVLRRFGVTNATVIVVSVLYTFLPYHIHRIPHLFLIHYELVPLSILVAVRLAQYRRPFAQESDDRPFRKRELVRVIVFGLILGASGAYYAAFSCFLFFLGGIGGALLWKKSGPLLPSLVMCFATLAGAILAVLPALEHKLSAPFNADASVRQPYHTELYALKITHLVLPTTEHRVPFLRHIKDRYNAPSTPLNTENDTATLGLMGTIGFGVLLVGFFRTQSAVGTPYLLSVFVVFMLLLAMMGGFSSLISYYLEPSVRCHNRISVFIAFSALLGFAGLLDRWRSAASTTHRQNAISGLALVMLLVVGLWDQIPRLEHLGIGRGVENANRDRAFVEELERRVEPGRLVYMLPFRSYPEGAIETEPVHFNWADLYRPLVHSKTLRWTFGALRGHQGDAWVRHFETMPLPERVKELAIANVAGIYLDRNAYVDRGAAVEKGLQEWCGNPWVVSEDQRMAYYDLTALAEKLREHSNWEEWDHRTHEAMNPVLPYYRKGFYTIEESPGFLGYRPSSPRSELELHNPLDYSREVRIVIELHMTCQPQPAEMKITGPLITQRMTLELAKTTRIEKVIEIPPGRHPIHFDLNVLAKPPEKDVFYRRLAFRISKLEIRDVQR